MTTDQIEQLVREEREREQRQRYQGFTIAELRAAFDRIQNPADWKAPIKATIGISELAATAAAVDFFTSTPLRVLRIDPQGNAVFVVADGYRAGPAGDH